MPSQNDLSNLQNRGLESYSGGRHYFALTAAMGSTPQLIKQGTGRLCRVSNGQAAAQTQQVTIYDWSDITNYSGKQILWQGTIPASTSPPIDIQLPCYLGLVIVSAAAQTGSILITYL